MHTLFCVNTHIYDMYITYTRTYIRALVTIFLLFSSGNGVVEVNDLKKYDVSRHPDVQAKKITPVVCVCMHPLYVFIICFNAISMISHML